MTSPCAGYKDAMFMIVSQCINTLDTGSIEDIEDIIDMNIQLIGYLSLKVEELQAKRKQLIMMEESALSKLNMEVALAKNKQEAKEIQISCERIKT